MAPEPPKAVMRRRQTPDWVVWLIALAGPAVLTAVLLGITGAEKRNYVFLYLGLIAAVGVARGLWPALSAAVVSFAFLDYFFVPHFYTFTISDPQDLLNLAVFVATATLVGVLASRRRRALLESEALALQLRDVNTELVLLNKEQAEAAQAALRLARSEQQVRSLQEADRLRRELLANVSHELRTPLGTILTESTDSSAPLTVADAGRRLGTLAAEARRLEALVNDMLDMARIEGGALDLDLEPVRLGDAITAAAERLHHVAATRAVEWDQPAAEVDVLADWARLGQVLDNLVGNAIKFTPEDGQVRVGVDHADGTCRVTVSDTGIGIPADERPKLFQRFYRASSATRQAIGGTGLGLAISKAIAESHDGTIHLADHDGPGTVFVLELPLATREEAHV